jgi:hypothetical protein
MDYYIKDDFPIILTLIYIINWIAWYRLMEDFWLSLLVGTFFYLIGWGIYGIIKTIQ